MIAEGRIIVVEGIIWMVQVIFLFN